MRRYACYRRTKDARLQAAERDVIEWRTNEPEPFAADLREP